MLNPADIASVHPAQQRMEGILLDYWNEMLGIVILPVDLHHNYIHCLNSN